MKCLKCGMDISDSANFCEFCGSKVDVFDNKENLLELNESVASIQNDSIESSDTVSDINLDKNVLNSNLEDIPAIFKPESNDIKIGDINTPTLDSMDISEDSVTVEPLDSELRIEEITQAESLNDQITSANTDIIPAIFKTEIKDPNIADINAFTLQGMDTSDEPIMMNPVDSGVRIEEITQAESLNGQITSANTDIIPAIFSDESIVTNFESNFMNEIKPMQLENQPIETPESIIVSNLNEPALASDSAPLKETSLVDILTTEEKEKLFDSESGIEANSIDVINNSQNINTISNNSLIEDISLNIPKSEETKSVDENPLDIKPLENESKALTLETNQKVDDVKIEQTKDNKQKNNIGTIIIIIVVILAALTGAAYYYLFNNKTISNIDSLSNSLSKMSEITSIKATGNLKYSYVDNKLNCINADQTNCINPNTDIDVDFDMSILYAKNTDDSDISQINIKNIQTGEDMSLYLITDKDNNKTSYISSKFIDMLGLTKTVNNIWLISTENNNNVDSSETILKINNIKIDNISAKEIFKEEDIILVDNVSGIDHYKIFLDENKYKQIMGEESSDSDNLFENFNEPIELNLYIDSNTKYITKLILTSSSNSTTNLNFTIDFSDINNTVVTLPEEVKNTTKTVESYISENIIIQ